MPSTYTTNGGIELPANGEQSATWGNTVNDNMSIIDRLTNGVGAITLSGTTHTLTTSNGVLSDGQYNVLVLGGSPSGTNTVTVSPNDGQRIYIVKNGSTQTATFTQGSGANVSVTTGTTKIIYCDGAGSGAAVVDLTDSLDLGELIVAGTTVNATGAELNTIIAFMAGVTATAAELNILTGVTSSTAELNILTGVTATAAELNILTGVTATTAELNILDGVTATTAELNLLDGVTATTAEINTLDGVTATAAELNYTGGVTSAIQTQLDSKTGSTAQDTSAWVDGTGTTETSVSPAKIKAAIDALVTPTPVKAWVNFNGIGTVSIRASSNVSSITDNSVGDYTVNFTTAFSSANYASHMSAGSHSVNLVGTASGRNTYTNRAVSGKSAGSCRFITGIHTGTVEDFGDVSFTAIGA